MENLIPHIPILIGMALLVTAVGFTYRQDRIVLSVVLLTLFGLILRIYFSLNYYLHPWDEQFHALVAKNLLNNPLKPVLYADPVLPYDFTDWTSNHIWLHKQPLALWSMAISMKLFGVNAIAIRIPSIVLSTLSIPLLYVLGSKLFNNVTGIVSAFLLATNRLIVVLTAGAGTCDHVDVFFMFFILLGAFFSMVYADRKKTIYAVLTGISLGMALLSKWLPALIIMPIWFFMVLHERMKIKTIVINGLLILGIAAVLFCPWQLYVQQAFPKEFMWESLYSRRHFFEVIEGHNLDWHYYFKNIKQEYGIFIYPAFVYALMMFKKQNQNLNRVAILMWFLIPFVFFTLARTKLQAYLIFSAPAMFLLIGNMLSGLLQYKKQWQKIVLSIIILITLATPVRLIVNKLSELDASPRIMSIVEEIKSLKPTINDRRILLFNCSEPIQAMFYTNCTAYKEIPNIDTLQVLADNGYSIYFFSLEGVPKEVLSHDAVLNN